MKVTHNRNIFYENPNNFNCKRQSIMKTSNMSGVNVRGFGNKLFIYMFLLVVTIAALSQASVTENMNC